MTTRPDALHDLLSQITAFGEMQSVGDPGLLRQIRHGDVFSVAGKKVFQPNGFSIVTRRRYGGRPKPDTNETNNAEPGSSGEAGADHSGVSLRPAQRSSRRRQSRIPQNSLSLRSFDSHRKRRA